MIEQVKKALDGSGITMTYPQTDVYLHRTDDE